MKDLILLAKGATKNQCPFDGAEVWGVNDVGSSPEFKGKKIDRIFTFDPRSPEFLAEARSVAPIWSWRDYADVKYPLDDVIKHFKSQYFTNTISYMIALAVYEGFTRIRMYGVDAPYGGIYFMEKSGLEYWIGRAQEAGIEVITAEGSDLLRTHDGLLYGQRGSSSIQMYLSERMFVMNMLPKEGSYDDVYMANLARWLVAVKVKEKEFHKIQLGSSPDGKIAYQCDHEFQATVHFPWWVLSYIKHILVQKEQQGKLPVYAIALYDKLVKLNMPERVGDVRDPYRKVRISYILNVKNRVRYINQFFNNIRKIVTPEDELIVIDGGSTDGTADVINKNRSLIDVFISEPDLSGSHALNKGILLARGKYIKQYPVDDIIYDLKDAVDVMEQNPKLDVLVLGGVKKDSRGESHTTAPQDYGTKPEHVFTYGACGTGFLIRKSSLANIGLFDPVDVNADREFILRAMEKGMVRFLQGDFYWHGIYNDSTSVNGIKQWLIKDRELMKQYCSRKFYLKRRMSKWIPLLKNS